MTTAKLSKYSFIGINLPFRTGSNISLEDNIRSPDHHYIKYKLADEAICVKHLLQA